MKTQEIARRWVDFFVSKGHTAVPSASLVSADPSLLFTVAGMVPFIPYLTAREEPPYTRATSVQKCIRTGDIEEVGKTVRHGTFFQMCGNFSFGDYFKKEAIHFAWELLTNSLEDGGYGLEKDRLWVTVYEDGDEKDLEARRIWEEEIGLPRERVVGTGKEDNYWNTGQPGPGGPCSEIYYDRGAEYGQEGGPAVDETRYIEIWNLVFMQYQLSAVRSKTDFDVAGELPKRNIDTGLGLERLAMILQGVENMYETDQVRPVLDKAAELAAITYTSTEDPEDPNHANDVRLRMIADHIRSSLMLISDGVTPGNEGRGYVLRRLIRRAVRAMRLMGVDTEVLPELLPVSRDAMKGVYPIVEEDFERIARIAYAEERAFRRTIASGTTRLDEALTHAKAEGHDLSGDDAFALHDTYGFPIDLTLEIASEAGLAVDEARFRELMNEQRTRAQKDAKAKKSGHADLSVYTALAEAGHVHFTGYDTLAGESKIRGIIRDGAVVPFAEQGQEIDLVLEETPFYAESGGQAGDVGLITGDGFVLEVTDVQAPVKGLNVHKVIVREGELPAEALVRTQVDAIRRHSGEQAHSATHLVHAALRQLLGDTATQAGSFNKAGYLRFDFSWAEALSTSARSEVEEVVNLAIAANHQVVTNEMALAEAKKLGAMSLFGEKYSNDVRVVEMNGAWSRELCGGTHVDSTARIGQLTLLSEASVGSGNRRVEALVGMEAFRHGAAERALVSELSGLFRVPSNQVSERVNETVAKLKAAEKQIAELKSAAMLAQSAQLLEKVVTIGATRLLAHNAGAVDSADALRTMALDLRGKLGSDAAVIVLIGVSNGRPLVLAVTNEEARANGFKAGALVRTATGVLGGGGGGKDDMAQGGGQDASRIDDALDAIRAALANG
ncbi:alanine--tRNA ligase [Glutamicibacter soli]|uniref:Alanine--tRNA ligase n=1 Tax=Glutamicibacter soli TaxID=453836 RepID=A0A365YMC7_9MICC|nr:MULTISPECIES: alanine--tRNA ligase [Micrococcaceae]ALD63983.1 alanyl-tRNA synthetase [Arthrobacter sp. LS16]ALQ30715.1 alanine--tRNA ligase [Arthrobacter sp. YC-RL1]KLI88002.1 alanyl-tRNA synthetase [Arthrobacter sp. YC-RL1]RBM03871.1 alanine--tRNA ligase [Glutamicibacter soli]